MTDLLSLRLAIRHGIIWLLAILTCIGIAAAVVSASGQSQVAADQQAVKPVSGPPFGYSASLTFAEEFDDPELDPLRWQTTYANPADPSPKITKRNLWSNREKQVYVDRDFLGLAIDPFDIEDGILTIEARPLNAAARNAVAAELSRLPENLGSTSLSKLRYSSGMISSRGRFAQRYGYFEMRARWSVGKGLWPAFWLLPEGGGWPPEIDIFEAHGDKGEISFHSLHLGQGRSTTERAKVPLNDDEFHTFGALWLPHRIDYFFDDLKVATIPVLEDIEEPMFLVANLAIGGAWPGDPDENTRFPARLEIDHIRVWSIEPIPQMQ